MRRGGYLARLARQSGVAIRGAPDGVGAPRAAAPPGLEVVTERVVAPVASPPAAVAEPRAFPLAAAPEPSVPAGRLTPVPPLEAGGRAREVEEERHPVVRVGETRSRPALSAANDAPATARIVPPEPFAAAVPLPRRAFAIDEEVIAMESEPARSTEMPLPESHADGTRPAPEQRPAPAGAAAAPLPPARAARTLADVRRWVAATPAPGEILQPGTAMEPMESSAVAVTPLVVREQVVHAANDGAAVLQELRVSIGRIEVVIDDPAPPAAAVPARAAAPVLPSNAPAPMRRLSRHYLRG